MVTFVLKLYKKRCSVYTLPLISLHNVVGVLVFVTFIAEPVNRHWLRAVVVYCNFKFSDGP